MGFCNEKIIKGFGDPKRALDFKQIFAGMSD